MPLVYFAQAMSRHPIVVVPVALVIAILCGAGKPFGLPRLFWNERLTARFTAGVALTLLFADVLLVDYLLDEDVRPTRPSFLSFVLVGAGVWALLVVPRLVLQEARYLGSSRRKGAGIGSDRGVAPAIFKVENEELSSRAALQVPAGAVAAGMAVGAVVAFLLAVLARSDLAAALSDLLLPHAPSWRPPPAEPWLHVLALIVLAALLAAFVLLQNRASPGVGFCFLLALVLAVDTAVEFWFQNAGFGLLISLGLLLWAGGLKYKLRIPPLAGLYRNPVPYPAQAPTSQAANLLLPFDVALAPGGKPERRRLIVICASGGGIRAAAWTAAILGRLDELDGFRAATRLMTGASGGMMGAASWLTLAANPDAEGAIPEPRWCRLMKVVAMDSLTPVARDLVFHDIPLAFIARNNLRDRGLALEKAWCDNLKLNLGIDLSMPLGELREGEKAGRWPSIVLSPMLVEDGRRLLISNLDFTWATDHYVRWLSSKATGTKPTTGLASRTAYQLSQLCPAEWARFPLSTAVRLSAAFPYVSSAVLLPTEPRRHVVDAGYYDNYGLELAGNWLRELFEQRRDVLKSISGILVIQIRDNVSELSVNPESDARRGRLKPRSSGGSRLLRALEGLTNPPTALLTARESVMLFRNDSLLESLSHLYSNAFGENFLTTTVFEFGGDASLSWHLAPNEVDLLEDQATSRGIELKLDAIESWLKGNGYWAPCH